VEQADFSAAVDQLVAKLPGPCECQETWTSSTSGGTCDETQQGCPATSCNGGKQPWCVVKETPCTPGGPASQPRGYPGGFFQEGSTFYDQEGEKRIGTKGDYDYDYDGIKYTEEDLIGNYYDLNRTHTVRGPEGIDYGSGSGSCENYYGKGIFLGYDYDADPTTQNQWMYCFAPDVKETPPPATCAYLAACNGQDLGTLTSECQQAVGNIFDSGKAPPSWEVACNTQPPTAECKTEVCSVLAACPGSAACKKAQPVRRPMAVSPSNPGSACGYEDGGWGSVPAGCSAQTGKPGDVGNYIGHASGTMGDYTAYFRNADYTAHFKPWRTLHRATHAVPARLRYARAHRWQ